MKKVYLLFLILLLTSFAYAVDDLDKGLNIKIINGSLSIEDYVTLYGSQINNTASIFDTFSSNFGNNIICQNPFVDVNGTNNTYYKQNDCHVEISFFKKLPMKKGFLNSSSNCSTSDYYIIDAKMQEELDDCKTDKALISGTLQGVNNELGTINNTYKDYVKCSSDLAVCGTKDSKVVELQKTIDDNKNTKWVWGAVALALGFAAAMFYTGKWGIPKVKHPEDSYNRSQSA